MGLLAPLYFAGFLAIGLPILFHLIRRNPKGRQVFSSLMFLQNSPPRLTRRSRLTNILLLILRALAIILLAFAFMRPFVHQGADLDNTPSTGRRIAILIDTSASMQRPDLWKQATDQAEQVLQDIKPLDQVGLFTFDQTFHPLMTLTDWNEADPSARISLLRTHLAAVKPTWFPTRLGDALAAAADLLAEVDPNAHGSDNMLRQIVLISDLQQGSHAEALQGHEWPKNVTLEIRPVTAKQTSNASVQWVDQAAPDSAQPASALHPAATQPESRLRVRVANEEGSKQDQFTLTWANDKGPIPGIDPVKVYVPAGRSQIIYIPWPDPQKFADQHPDRLHLAGDDCDFDNTLFVLPPQAQTLRIVYLGDDADEDANGLRYYLHSVLADTPRRKVDFIARTSAESLADSDLQSARLVVITDAPSQATLNKLRPYMDSGGSILWILKSAAEAPPLARFINVPALSVEEAPSAPNTFSLIDHIDTSSPLFAPFADARFGDFTKIHFWKHRHLALPNQAANAVTTLARFDDGDPFLLETSVGRGTLRILTSGWQPADSQLALSTKFVPLIEGFLLHKEADSLAGQYTLGQPVLLPPPAETGVPRTLVGPDGQSLALAPSATTFDTAERLGIYRLAENGLVTQFALNLSPDESRTIPLTKEELEQWGARLGGRPATTEEKAQQRQLRISELENRQKLWRWLIVCVLGLLAVETALAGRLARRASKVQAS